MYLEREGMARLLIVEDDDDIRELLAEVLQMLGHDVSRAGNGQEGLERLRESKPDAVLLDVEMPGTGGYEVCKALKASPAVADVPVIFMTQLPWPGRRCRTAAGRCRPARPRGGR